MTSNTARQGVKAATEEERIARKRAVNRASARRFYERMCAARYARRQHISQQRYEADTDSTIDFLERLYAVPVQKLATPPAIRQALTEPILLSPATIDLHEKTVVDHISRGRVARKKHMQHGFKEKEMEAAAWADNYEAEHEVAETAVTDSTPDLPDEVHVKASHFTLAEELDDYEDQAEDERDSIARSMEGAPDAQMLWTRKNMEL